MYGQRYLHSLLGNSCAGRQMRVNDGSMRFAGTIVSVDSLKLSMLRFNMAWCAYFDTASQQWKWWKEYLLLLPNFNEPMQLYGSGELQFTYRCGGSGTIFAPGHTYLPAGHVRNIPEAWERLYAQYSTLPLISEMAQQALLSCGTTLALMHTLTRESTVGDLLKLIPGHTMREQFLLSYIRWLTGNLNVHLKVY